MWRWDGGGGGGGVDLGNGGVKKPPLGISRVERVKCGGLVGSGRDRKSVV